MTQTPLEALLDSTTDADWLRVLRTLADGIHLVDREATRIWLAFHPIVISRAARHAADRTAFERRYVIEGRYRLEELVSTSHWFLYGHRFWPAIVRAIETVSHSRAAEDQTDVVALVRRVAHDAATQSGVSPTLTAGIALVGLRTLQQVGLEAMQTAPDTSPAAGRLHALTPDQVLAARARDDKQGLFGFLRGERKQWTVTLDERDPSASFTLINSQAITTAAAEDRRDWRARDPRCTEGPIPVQCRSASCGTCWIGVLGGAHKLSAMEPRERQRLAVFGYLQTTEDRPVIRLACQAQAYGAVSIVIPPWNGVFGSLVRSEP